MRAIAASDPSLPLNCPKCRARMVYGATTVADSKSGTAGEAFPTGAEVHHYRCPGCGRFWKLGPADITVQEDALRLAESGAEAH